MPSLKTLSGRPSPMAWADPASAAVQPKPCDVRRSQWPFLVQGEEIIPYYPPSANGKADAAAQPMQSSAHAAAPGGAVSAKTIAAVSVTATSISAGAIFPTLHRGGMLAAGALKASELAQRCCTSIADSPPGTFGTITAAQIADATPMQQQLTLGACLTAGHITGTAVKP
jgi:hypothetical protein